MNRKEKYDAILAMQSVYRRTAGQYPSRREFYQALTDNRVVGDYNKGITIVSNNIYKRYVLVKE